MCSTESLALRKKPHGFWPCLGPPPSTGQRRVDSPVTQPGPLCLHPWSFCESSVWICFPIFKWTDSFLFSFCFNQDDKCSEWFGVLFVFGDGHVGGEVWY